MESVENKEINNPDHSEFKTISSYLKYLINLGYDPGLMTKETAKILILLGNECISLGERCIKLGSAIENNENES